MIWSAIACGVLLLISVGINIEQSEARERLQQEESILETSLREVHAELNQETNNCDEYVGSHEWATMPTCKKDEVRVWGEGEYDCVRNPVSQWPIVKELNRKMDQMQRHLYARKKD